MLMALYFYVMFMLSLCYHYIIATNAMLPLCYHYDISMLTLHYRYVNVVLSLC